MLKFSATSAGSDTLNLPRMLEDFANRQWIPAHMTQEQAIAFVVDQFKRTLYNESQLVEISCEAFSDEGLDC